MSDIIRNMKQRLPGAESVTLPAAMAWELIDSFDALLAEVERLRALLVVDDAMVERAIAAAHEWLQTHWRVVSEATNAEMTRVSLEAALLAAEGEGR